METILNFIAVVSGLLCLIFTLAFISDIPYLKYEPHPVWYALLGVTLISITGYVSYVLW